MFGEKIKVKLRYVFKLDFWGFYKKASKRNFIKNPYIRGLKNLYKYLFTYCCIEDINKTLDLNVRIEDFKRFNDLYLMCKDWENQKVSKYLMAYLNRKGA